MRAGEVKLGVSLFSYSSVFYLGEKSLTDLLKKSKEAGAEGIEIVASQMIPGYPYPSREWLRSFRDECEQLGLEPFCYSAHLDSGLRSDRWLTEEEKVLCTVNDLRCAKDMGASVVRTQQTISPKLMYEIAPWAERYGIKVGVEIHPPHTLSTDVWQEFIRVFEDIDSPYVGIVMDLGIYQEYPYDGWITVYASHGVSHATIAFLLSALKEGQPLAEVLAVLEKQNASEYAREMAQEMFALYRPYRPDQLADVMKYITHFHTKFYHMKNGEEETIPYRQILQIIKETGFSGYLISEYEGHYVYDEQTVSCFDQVREHIAMERRLLNA